MESESQQTEEYVMIDIYETLRKLTPLELDWQNSHPFCVCQVPDSLTLGKPEAFVPRFVGLGPYHHFRKTMTVTNELKLAAAKRVLKNLVNDKNLFDQVVKNYPSDMKIFYHVDVKSAFHDVILFHVLTIDGLFLLAFLTLLNHHPEGFSYFLTGRLGMPLFNAVGIELTKNTLIREVFMLENQIPIHVLSQISRLVTARNTIQPCGADLGSVLKDFCIEHRPLYNSLEHPENPEACNHLLDLMYQLIVPPEHIPDLNQQNQPTNQNGTNHPSGFQIDDFNNDGDPKDQETQSMKPKLGNYRRCCSVCSCILVFNGSLCFILWFIFRRIVKILSGVILFICFLVFKAFRVLYNLLEVIASWFNPVFSEIHRTLSNLQANYPSVTPYTKLVEALEKNTGKKKEEKDSDDEDVGPAVMIHSVTELHRAGIIVKPAEAGISTIKFDVKKGEFYLPCIRVDTNTEVIMKNLMAYESLTKPNSLKFTRYVELMRAIVDTPEDVKLLVHGQVIHSELRYKAIADIFNGMGKSIRKDTKTPILDKVVNKVNAMYDAREKRKKFMEKYTSPKLISVVGGLVFLALTAMQTYCSVYNCSGTGKK